VGDPMLSHFWRFAKNAYAISLFYMDLVEPSVQDYSYTGIGLVNFLIALSKKEFTLAK